MTQQPLASVLADLTKLHTALWQANAAIQGLAEACQEDDGMDQVFWNEITRLRQELNDVRAELRDAHQRNTELEADRDKWLDLAKSGPWTPLISKPIAGTFVPATSSAPSPYIYGTTTTASPHMIGGGSGAPDWIWTAPASGEYTVSFPPATYDFPTVMTIGTGTTSQTVTVSNVTLEGYWPTGV